jgi:hypothetical protein
VEDDAWIDIRARRRNKRAAIVSLGLVFFAFMCCVTLATGFGAFSSGASADEKQPPPGAVLTTTTLEPPPETAPPETTTTTTTTVPPTTTTVGAPILTVPPTTTTVPRPATTTTTVPTPSATVTNSNAPAPCTVTVKLSSGARESYALNSYVSEVGDSYVFTAHLGVWNVVVTTTVKSTGPTCESKAGTVARDPV